MLHCWTDRLAFIEAMHGYLSDEYCEFLANGMSGTCMLPHDHAGPHEFTDDDKIGVTFAPAK